MKPKVRRRTMFGDDNHEAIDAQIRVLEEGLDEDDVYDKFEPTGDDGVDHDEWRNDHVLDHARGALQWREGEEEEAPSIGWAPLIER